MVSKTNLDITGERLSLANTFLNETDNEGWLQVDMAGLDLKGINQISINLGQVEDLKRTIGQR